MRKVLRIAFVKSVPVMAGYLSIGIAFGLLMQEMGYNVFWALLIVRRVYAICIAAIFIWRRFFVDCGGDNTFGQ